MNREKCLASTEAVQSPLAVDSITADVKGHLTVTDFPTLLAGRLERNGHHRG